MRVIEVPGGWYGEAWPVWETWAVSKKSVIVTHGGEVDIPGMDVLYLRTWPAPFKMAGQGHHDDTTKVWQDGRWTDDGPCVGVSPVIFDDFGKVISVRPGNSTVGSQGYRFVEEGRIWTGDQTYFNAGLNLSEWTQHGDVIVGQDHDNDSAIVVYGGVHYILDPHPSRFIRFNRVGSSLAVTIPQFALNRTLIYFLDTSEIPSLAKRVMDAPATPTPTPTTPEDPKVPEPKIDQALLDAVYDRLESVRKSFPESNLTREQGGELLNQVTIPFASKGVGMQKKTGGYTVVAPDGETIASDIIRFTFDGAHFGADMLGDAEGAARPTRASLGVADPDTFKAPVDRRVEEPPVDPADPTVDNSTVAILLLKLGKHLGAWE